MKNKNWKSITSTLLGGILLVVGLGGVGYMGIDYVRTNKFTENEETRLEHEIKVTDNIDTSGTEYHSSSLTIESLDADQTVNIEDEQKNTMSIPSLKILAPIAEGTDMKTLKYNVGHFTETGDLGKKGNFAVAGHSSSIYKCILNGLSDIKLGDEIIFYDSKKEKYVYYCVETKVVNPTDLSVLEPSSDVQCTVITCTNNGTQRLCVVGKQLSNNELEEYRKEWYADRLKNLNNILSNLESTITLNEIFEE